MTPRWSRADERPLTARSVIASTLLGVHPPRLPTGLLVRSCGLFGISPGTARVAVSRMVAAGELVADDGGYALSGPLLARQSRQDLSRSGATRAWDPDHDAWRTVVVVAEGRSAAERNALRRAAVAVRLAERREGVWLRPDNLPRDLPASAEAEAVLATQGIELAARPAVDPAALAAALWDLGAWATRAEVLLDALDRTLPALEAHDLDALTDGFVLSAAVLRHLQADPLLPETLVPPRWPGGALRDAHRRWDRAFGAVWTGWYRSAAGPGASVAATPT